MLTLSGAAARAGETKIARSHPKYSTLRTIRALCRSPCLENPDAQGRGSRLITDRSQLELSLIELTVQPTSGEQLAVIADLADAAIF